MGVGGGDGARGRQGARPGGCSADGHACSPGILAAGTCLPQGLAGCRRLLLWSCLAAAKVQLPPLPRAPPSQPRPAHSRSWPALLRASPASDPASDPGPLVEYELPDSDMAAAVAAYRDGPSHGRADGYTSTAGLPARAVAALPRAATACWSVAGRRLSWCWQRTRLATRWWGCAAGRRWGGGGKHEIPDRVTALPGAPPGAACCHGTPPRHGLQRTRQGISTLVRRCHVRGEARRPVRGCKTRSGESRSTAQHRRSSRS